MKRIALALAILGAPMVAAAADYPYAGYFAAGKSGEDPDDVRLMCANGFFRQDTDGSFVNYHLDVDAHRRDGTIRYLRYGDGTCRVSERDRIETCTMAFSTDAADIGAVYVSAIDFIGPELVRFRYFDTVEEARSYLAGETPAPELTYFVRCNGFSDRSLAAYVSDAVSTLGVEERAALLVPDLDDDDRARLEAILGRIQSSP